MPIPRKDNGKSVQRALIATALAGLFLICFGYFAVASLAIKSLYQARPSSLLSSSFLPSDIAAAAPVTLSPAVTDTALAAQPMNQALVNVAMRQAVQRGQDATPWLAVLQRMGWHDTYSLVNVMVGAANKGDIKLLIDVLDALMRREKGIDQAVAAFQQGEMDPEFRAMLTRRLMTRPNWKYDYLYRSYALRDPASVLVRYELVGNLQRAGIPLERAEISGLMTRLVQIGRADLAYRLWHDFTHAIPPAIQDGTFHDLANRSKADADHLFPFEWSLETGADFEVYAGGSRHGDSNLTIRWNEHGVPLFASQQTSLRRGTPTLTVTAVSDVDRLGQLDLRLRCPDGATIALVPTHRDGNSQAYATRGALPCDFPRLEIAGALSDHPTDVEILIARIAAS